MSPNNKSVATAGGGGGGGGVKSATKHSSTVLSSTKQKSFDSSLSKSTSIGSNNKTSSPPQPPSIVTVSSPKPETDSIENIEQLIHNGSLFGSTNLSTDENDFIAHGTNSAAIAQHNHHRLQQLVIDSDGVQRLSIVDFYRKRSILITGGSGFVGKVLIEKLLYEFRDIDKVYLLLRPKAGQMIQKRLAQMTESPVFNRIRTECPEQFQKLVAISGDVGYPMLGINPIDLNELIENVSVIFHSAATIRFDEPLRYALEINTIGTKRMIQLAQKLNNLAAFIHVSTAYCTVEKYNIEEKIYLEPILPDRIIEMAEWMDDETLNKLAPVLYRGRPSSYHYTKSLAENLVALEVYHGYRPPFGHQLYSSRDAQSSPPPERIPFPAAIIRPSIITASWKDPYPGWIDNYNGTTGFLVVCGKGVLRTVHCTKSYLCDLIPVDVVINTCIASAWHIHCNVPKRNFSPQDRRTQLNLVDNLDYASSNSSLNNENNNKEPKLDDVFVVNCCSSHLNPVSWGQLYDISYPYFFKYPSSEMFRVPGVRYHRHQLAHQLNVYLEHHIPAYLVDFIFRFTGYPPILDQVYQKVHRASTAFEHFTNNEWTYQGRNLLLLSEAIAACNQMKASSILNESGRIEIAKNGTIPSTSSSSSKSDAKYTRKSSMSNGSIPNDSQRNPFPIDLRELCWNDYIESYILGIRQYLLKEDPATIPEARNQLLLIRTLTTVAKMATAGTVAYQLLNPNSLTRNCLQLIRAYLPNSQRRLLRPASIGL